MPCTVPISSKIKGAQAATCCPPGADPRLPYLRHGQRRWVATGGPGGTAAARAVPPLTVSCALAPLSALDVLCDDELNAFQATVFEQTLSAEELDGIKEVSWPKRPPLPPVARTNSASRQRLAPPHTGHPQEHRPGRGRHWRHAGGLSFPAPPLCGARPAGDDVGGDGWSEPLGLMGRNGSLPRPPVVYA